MDRDRAAGGRCVDCPCAGSVPGRTERSRPLHGSALRCRLRGTRLLVHDGSCGRRSRDHGLLVAPAKQDRDHHQDQHQTRDRQCGPGQTRADGRDPGLLVGIQRQCPRAEGLRRRARPRRGRRGEQPSAPGGRPSALGRCRLRGLGLGCRGRVLHPVLGAVVVGQVVAGGAQVVIQQSAQALDGPLSLQTAPSAMGHRGHAPSPLRQQDPGGPRRCAAEASPRAWENPDAVETRGRRAGSRAARLSRG